MNVSSTFVQRPRALVMRMFKLPKVVKTIGGRLGLALACLLLATAGIGGFAVNQLNAVQAANSEISDKWMAGVRLTSQMNTDASDFRIAEAKHILASDENERARYDAELDTFAGRLERNASDYARLISSAEEKKLFNDFKRERQRYLDENVRMMRLSRNGQAEDAKALLVYNSQKKYEGASAALRRLVDHNIAAGRSAGDAGQATYLSARRWIFAVLACTIVFGAVLSWAIARSITRPLNAAASVADSVAHGDLTVHVPPGGSDETGQLLKSLKVMTSNLSRLVSTVRMGSEEVAVSSNEIATGNSDLSHRTELQAARLQHTASSMVQLNEAVQAVDASASGAARLADEARRLADKGGEVVGEVVKTMREIALSSERIGEITGVINSIAFKTNILALNAAVEAARAGEAGRGFGVVAGEVRALAQSCAQAAKDIKNLIDESKGKVQAGGSLVSQAGVTMNAIGAQVNSVNDMIGQIGSATRAQTVDIAQVCESVAELDRTTQQNAALVEQSAAASEGLREQAQYLVEAVAAFKTSQGWGAAEP
jgi:methyl-accepting chemotaxis protein